MHSPPNETLQTLLKATPYYQFEQVERTSPNGATCVLCGVECGPYAIPFVCCQHFACAECLVGQERLVGQDDEQDGCLQTFFAKRGMQAFVL